MSEILDYKKKTKKSAKLFLASSKIHVNGVSHNIRFFQPYPFIVKSSSGKNLQDVDDNKYTDYWMGHWSLILGHGPKQVKDSLKKQIEKSWMYGTVNEQTIKLSELITKAVPVAEKIRYATTGTEATMYAVRLARSVTGKKIIAKIDGGWHGYTSDLLKSVNWPFTESESGGIINEEKIISIPFNDLEKSLVILNKISTDLAGIIIEPVLGGGGCIPATQEYLKGLEEFAHKNNSLIILDEIVTGFRFRFGCLYPTINLDPDIVTLGKIVGGGMPIGVLCGKKEIMKFADTSGNKKSERAYIGGGTFSANPMSMTSGFATLSELKKSKNMIYPKINSLGKFARDELGKIFGSKVIITGKGSLFMTHFVSEGITEITNSAQAAKCDTKSLYNYHFKMIAQDGIFFLPGKLGAISNVHTKEDIKKIITATDNFEQTRTSK
ncbi:MAG: aminotransferase class III-fold pyridoxal phosphate-dependent enzyme [Nitrosarchaeum sp.]|nr:aminotransferase class III-fold pyridoxal phosphate-dependent enzyme [Nitrosarchaeum sp.]MBP0120041.1 aminotransferase class III-fold pyridoxal phosphate-dependent enzyme [Nitrosarchaeum sp.]